MAAQTKPMTKAQLITEMSEKLAMSKKDVKAFFDLLAEVGCAETKKCGSFTVPGFGKMVKIKRQARKGRNPATGEEITIKAKTVVKFRLAKSCKDAIAPPQK
jgi:DNA-binding protein HU-beta